MIKIVYTFLYLILFFIFSATASSRNKHQLKQVIGQFNSTLKNSALELVLLILVFIQYWVLTGTFPFLLVLLLIAANAIGTIIYVLVGSIAGFSLNENIRKIRALSVIWGAQNSFLGCAFFLASLLTVAIMLIGNIWALWHYPYGSPEAHIWIALFLFAIPQLIFIPISIFTLWPIVTSEYIDNDLRNAQLTSGFSQVIYRTVILLFPIWILKNSNIQSFQINLPSFWTLLSIPILLFVIGSLLPYFIGIYRYKSQALLMIRWREKWLLELLEYINLPLSNLRDKGVNEKLNQLKEETSQRFSQNNLFHYYQNRIDSNLDDSALLPTPDEPIEPPSVKPEETTNKDIHQDSIGETLTANSPMLVIKDFFTRKPTTRKPSDEHLENIILIIEQNKMNLKDWDIRFEHLYKLLQLYEIGSEGKTKDVSRFIEARLEKISGEIKTLTTRKSFFAAAILSSLSTFIVWFFKTYQNEIIALINNLVKSW